ncbi:MAG: RHS repeat-associated core domain-containing protein [Bacillota bacterium]|nr:RHS repeat-associated core domain-containing protein [Bacillota bacterium]
MYSYTCDTETGFNYLQSKYYDPAICRFINADGQLNEGFLGLNLFAYCENNPRWIMIHMDSLRLMIYIMRLLNCGIGDMISLRK